MRYAIAIAASLLFGACSGMPRTPAGTTAEAPPAKLNCLQNTGSRIKPAEGQCLSVVGRVYSGEQVRGTGAINTAEALYRLGL